MYDPGIGRWLQEDPIGFDGGDTNLYRYAGNRPTFATDPSGLQTGLNNHGYPLHLGGSTNQPLVRLLSEADHRAFHRYLRANNIRYGEAGRTAWRSLSLSRQRALIVGALRAANVPMSVITANIDAIMAGANPGVRTLRVSGAPGGIIRFTAGMAALVVYEILANPTTAQAAEMGATWRSQSPTTMGRVEIAETYFIIDRRRWWNIYPFDPAIARPYQISPNGNWYRYAQTSNWTDLGDMTLAEARALEGVYETQANPDVSPFVAPPPYDGWYRTSYRGFRVRFNGVD